MSDSMRGRGAASARALERAAAEMLDEVRMLPPELITWHPAPGVWSIMDILCHVQEFVPYWIAQTLQVVAHPDQPWGRDHTNAERLAAVANTGARTLIDVEDGIRAAVQQAAATLESVRDADFEVEAMSRNPRWGVKPASFIVEHLLVQHVDKHIGQIRRNVGQFQQRGQSAQ